MKLLSAPGLAVLRATFEGETVGMHIQVVHPGMVYGHLAAYSNLGYATGASSALHFQEMVHFSGKGRFIDWGDAAGGRANASDSLATFKRGSSNCSRTTYLCGRVFDRRAYDQLCSAAAPAGSSYFPEYRHVNSCDPGAHLSYFRQSSTAI